ncbi:MAG: carbon-nitrogen hydrolase family protein [Planctomycetes bacterium]|nr:carbon-nitrogen hydrolase family protein [Planctomycetota bacterium]
MSRRVKIAALQMPAWVEGDTPREKKAFHLRHILQGLHDAGREGADVVCLGECSTTSHIQAPRDDREIWEDAYAGPSTLQVAEAARTYRMNVVLPVCAVLGGRLQNLALYINRGGRVLGHYAKVHPTRLEMKQGVVEGDRLGTVDFDFGRVGTIICHDMSFPEAARCVALEGAEIIFWPSWWSGWGEELCYAVIKSRAIDNGVYLVHVGFGARDGTAWRPGMNLARSGVIGPDGLILSSAGRYAGISLASVDLDKPRLAHSWTWGKDQVFREAMLADRRPRVYGAIVDETRVPPAVEP